MSKVKSLIKAVTNPKESAKLSKSKNQYEEAKTAYQSELAEMHENEELYNGTREVQGNPNKKKAPTKKAINVRNIAYEFVETQVDSSIPMPKVVPIHEEDKELAQVIETALQNEIRLLKFNELNDKQERIVPMLGGDYFHVEWDNRKGGHCNVGDLSVTERHPSTVIPQQGVTEVQDMDYIFVVISMTKAEVKRRYGIDVKDAGDTETNKKTNKTLNEDIVSVIKKYYKNEDGGIGVFTWCDDYIIEDMEDYQARQLEKCKKCGRIKDGDVCECGSRSFEKVKDEYEEITEDIVTVNGTISAIGDTREEFLLDENGNGILGEDGYPVMTEVIEHTKIPYYKPDCFPLVLRRNVSKYGKVLGCSDISVIKDQQDAIKKLGSKIQEKIVSSGSVLCLPQGINVSDENYQIVRPKNPAEVAMIQALNLQVNVSQDLAVLERNYDYAQSTLGITDAFQGKPDYTAASGTAKQYAINQAAGRLESKRVMKRSAYATLYEMMFKFLLAYSDQPIPLSKKANNGDYEFSHFNRYDFLKKDAAGEWYWNDEFIIETDPTSTIMMNREAMWQQADFKLQSQAFGPLGDTNTLLLYWRYMEENDYPNASKIRKNIEERQQKEQEQLQEQMLAQQGGMENAMPTM